LEKGNNIMREEEKLQYPCNWQYKAIGRQQDLLHEAIRGVFQGVACEITYSHSSKTGKYHSYTIEMMVADELERNRYFQELKKSSHIIMVI